jgi:hypothetical protein
MSAEVRTSLLEMAERRLDLAERTERNEHLQSERELIACVLLTQP